MKFRRTEAKYSSERIKREAKKKKKKKKEFRLDIKDKREFVEGEREVVKRNKDTTMDQKASEGIRNAFA